MEQETIERRGPGRPRVDRSDKVMRTFETTIPLDVRLVKKAEEREITVSALIREILEKYFENREI